MNSIRTALILFVLVVAAILGWSSLYTVDMREQVIITQFSRVIGEPVKEPGLHFKVPFVQNVNRFSNQILEWDGPSADMPTRDKLVMVVDNFARWRITDPLKFYVQVGDERAAQSRLNNIIGGATRDIVASHNFIEVVRTTKGRQAERDASLAGVDSRIGQLPDITVGREKLERLVLERAQPGVKSLGIELMDVRFKRLNYTSAVSQTIYGRMSSEREQIAERFRSEGMGEAAKIMGNRERDLNQIESEAYKKVQETEGEADARATQIYASAYNQTPQAVELFTFIKAMDTLKRTITPETTLILSTEGDLLRFLKSSDPAAPTTGKGPADPLKGLPSLLDLPGK